MTLQQNTDHIQTIHISSLPRAIRIVGSMGVLEQGITL
jgi:hypothetical protein